MPAPDFLVWHCAGCGAAADGKKKPCNCATNVGERRGPHGELETTWWDDNQELTAQEAASAFVMLWTRTKGRTTDGLRDGIASLLTEAYKRGYDAGFKKGQRAI